MIEKQARIKQAGVDLKTAIAAVAEENQANIRTANDNFRVMVTKEGTARAYQNTAFLRMIKFANALVALSAEE